jgi:hypothetical protein
MFEWLCGGLVAAENGSLVGSLVLGLIFVRRFAVGGLVAAESGTYGGYYEK